ncbi:MAG: DUF4388 domain-containing protein [Caldisericia bacterium]
MGIEGNIESFPLTDVITLLSNSGKSGILYIIGKKSGESLSGEIHLKNGKIVNAICKDLKGEEAFYYLFLIDEGNFSFKPKEINTPTLIDKSVDLLMIEAIRMSEETKDLYKKIPPLHTLIEINPNPPENNIELSPEEWQVLNSFFNPISINDAIKNINFPETKVIKIIYALLSVGLLKKSEKLINIPLNIYNQISEYIEKTYGPKGLYFFTYFIEKGITEKDKFINSLENLKKELITLSNEKVAEDTIKYIRSHIF